MDKVKVKSVKALDREGWCAQFTIGVQTFSLATRDTKKEADWYCNQLLTAFKVVKIGLLKEAHDHGYEIGASPLQWSIEKSWIEFLKQNNLIHGNT